MKYPIRPATLKALREHRGLSQAKLEARSEEMHQKVGIATIKRIEAWTKAEMYMAHGTVAKRLAKALCFKVEDLARELSGDSSDLSRELRKPDKHPLRTAMDDNTWLAFRMVEHLYGIPVRTQIEMAPLCMALLAEGSLAWRRKRLAEINEKAEELHSLGGGNFSFAHAASFVENPASKEEESIRERDVFGRKVDEITYDMGYDPYTNNPFADYLRALAQELDDADIELDPDGHDEIGPDGFPEYRIGGKLLAALTGGNSDRWSQSISDAEYALAHGYVKPGDIPDELRGEDKTEERVKWIVSHIPEKLLEIRRKAHAAHERLVAKFAHSVSEKPRAEQGGHSQ